MELEIKEDFEALIGHLAHPVGPVGREHLQADFNPREGALQLAEEGAGDFPSGNIESEDELGRHRRIEDSRDSARKLQRVLGSLPAHNH